MSVTVKPAPAETPDGGVIEEARARQRRHRTLAAAGVIAASVTAALLLGSAGGGRGSHRGSASVPAGRLPSKTTRSSSAACGQGGALQGAPSRSLLSILGVLRRPATAADAGSGIAARGFISGVFVHYIRLARVVNGSPYYIYPGILGGCGTGETPHEGIMELARNVDLGHGLMGGTGGGGATAAAIEQGKDASSGPPGSATSSTITMIVPDGVAKVTLRYPAGRASGYSPKISPAFTVTTAPVGNLVVVTLPRSNPLQQGTIIWRSADGRVIKTFDGLGI
ncbi:MAG: hypothetical protein ACLQMH_15555 [Solirubrobacteraceae bacterium]